MNKSTRNLFLTNKNRCYNLIGENDKDWKDRDIAAVYKYKSENEYSMYEYLKVKNRMLISLWKWQIGWIWNTIITRRHSRCTDNREQIKAAGSHYGCIHGFDNEDYWLISYLILFKELKQPITKCNKVSMIHIDSIDFFNINLYSLSIVLLTIIVQYMDNLLDSQNSDSFNSYWLLVYMFLFETNKEHRDNEFYSHCLSVSDVCLR